MSRSSGRGQAEPLAALAAAVAVCVGLSVYAVAAVDGVPRSALDAAGDRAAGDRAAAQAADRLRAATVAGGVLAPDGLSAAVDSPGVAPDGYRLNATLRVGDDRWTVGPPVPTGAPPSGGSSPAGASSSAGESSAAVSTASERVAVRVGPGAIRPGRLTVRVWP